MFDFEKDPASSLLFIAFLVAVGIGLYYVISRWVFSINKQLDNQERTLQLLRQILEKIK